MTGHDSNPFRSPSTVDPRPKLTSQRFARAKKWAIRALLVTGIPALLAVTPVLLHEFGVAIPRIFRLFSPNTSLFILYPEMIALPSAILAWIASWVLPINDHDWTPDNGTKVTPNCSSRNIHCGACSTNPNRIDTIRDCSRRLIAFAVGNFRFNVNARKTKLW